MFGLTWVLGYSTVQGLIEQEKRHKADAEKAIRKEKIRIKDANTKEPGIAKGASANIYYKLPYVQRMKVIDYLDELKQQAKWDAEKCANQQSLNK